MGKYTAELLEEKLIKSYEAIKTLQARLANQQADPIAIIGMACRFPGHCNSPEEYWNLLLNKGEGIEALPADRMDDLDDPSIRGGFVDDVYGFDAFYFGISPNEARSLDPQQRLLLEVCHEAFERANLPVDDLEGSPTGVFVGQCNNDYGQRSLRSIDQKQIGHYDFTGNIFSTTAGRLAFHFGLQGPAMVVDTACSSSLVAVDLAVRALQNHQCNLAIAAGTNLMLDGNIHVALSQVNALSETGTCSAFDQAANGYVRSEGVACILLKSLKQAGQDGNRIIAVIRASAINHDGRSNGFTSPNSISQQQLLRQAINASGLEPWQLDYLEAHGTGTKIGDPIEMEAINQTYLAGRSSQMPLYIGASKTNIGHTECTAGLAGLIKAALVVDRRLIPPNIRFSTPNPLIDWHPAAIIPTEVTPIQRDVAYAAVSSFGFSGTNAHIILESPPQTQRKDYQTDGPGLLFLSVKQAENTTACLERYLNHLKHTRLNWTSICRTSALGRSHHAHRMVVVARNRDEAIEIIETALTTGQHSQLIQDQALPSDRISIGFVFTGQGSQYLHMGKDLYLHFDRFAQAIDQCDEAFRIELGTSLKSIMFEENPDQLLDQTRYAQPAIFAFEYALFSLLEDHGISAQAVMGHSIGEFAAACCAGILTFDDAVKLVATRGGLMQTMPSGGKMAVVFTDEQSIEPLLPDYPGISIAAINSNKQTVISGRPDQVETLVNYFTQQNIRTRYLNVSHAFHSPDMAGMLDEFEQLTQSIPHYKTQKTFVSCLKLNQQPDSRYWVDHVISPVRFREGLHQFRQHCNLILEIGPAPHLSAIIRMDDLSQTIHCISAIDKREDETRAFERALARLHCAGVNINLKKWFGASGQPDAELPTYPWIHKRFRIEKPVFAATNPEYRSESLVHPLSGQPLNHPEQAETWYKNFISPNTHAYLNDHRVGGEILFPGTGYLELALSLSFQRSPHNQELLVTDLVIHEPMKIPQQGLELQTKVQPEDSGSYQIVIYSRQAAGPWIRHATCLLKHGRPAKPLFFKPSVEGEQLDTSEFYLNCSQVGIEYGPQFRGLKQIIVENSRMTGVIELPETDPDQYYLHPALVDSAFQIYGTRLLHDEQAAFLPVEIHQVCYFKPATRQQLVEIIETENHGKVRKADVRLFSNDGEAIAEIKGLTLIKTKVSHSTNLAGSLYTEIFAEQTIEHILSPIHPDLNKITVQATSSDELLQLKSCSDQYRKLNQFAVSYILTAFSELDLSFEPEQIVGIRSLTPRPEAGSPLEQLVNRMFSILQEEQIIQATSEPGIYRVPKSQNIQSTDVLRDDMKAALSGCKAEAELLHQCASNLAGIIRGTVSPLSVLFPGGDTHLVNQLYHTLPFRAMHELAARLVGQLTKPGKNKLNIIEIGAGTGSTTEFILPLLSSPVNYTYTDISPLFISEAREKFSEYDFIRYATLDIEQDPEFQGFEQEYDLVLAANVIHATTNLSTTLGNLRKLLRPGGALLMIEGTTIMPWLDLIFGLTKGWWAFQDFRLDQQHILLGSEVWEKILSETGFETIRTVEPGESEGLSLTAQTILLAQAPQPEKKEHLLIGFDAPDQFEGLRAQLSAHWIQAGNLKEQIAPFRGKLETVTFILPSNQVVYDTLAEQCLQITSLLDNFSPTAVRILVTGNRLQFAAMKGLVKTIRLEIPELQPKLIFIPEDQTFQTEALAAEIVRTDQEEIVILDRQQRMVNRLSEIQSSCQDQRLSIDRTGAYLITGGTGGLGLQVAGWLSRQQAGEIILLARHLPKEDQENQWPANWHFYTCDLGMDTQVQQVIQHIEKHHFPLKGVIHAAGVVSDAALTNQTANHFAEVFRAKVFGTENLIKQIPWSGIDFFAAFSSSASTLGMPGQVNHCVANSLMEELLTRDQQKNQKIRIINWGAWERTGAVDAFIEHVARQQGMSLITPDEGFSILETTLQGSLQQLSAFNIDWAIYNNKFGSRPFLEKVRYNRTAVVQSKPEQNWKELLNNLPSNQRPEKLDWLINRLTAQALGYDDPGFLLDRHTGFFALGLDSLVAVSLRNQLQQLTGLELEATLLFNRPTIDELSKSLLNLLFPNQEESRYPIQKNNIESMQEDELEDFINQAFNNGNPQ